MPTACPAPTESAGWSTNASATGGLSPWRASIDATAGSPPYLSQGFGPLCAERLVELAGASSGETVLDVATGGATSPYPRHARLAGHWYGHRPGDARRCGARNTPRRSTG